MSNEEERAAWVAFAAAALAAGATEAEAAATADAMLVEVRERATS